MNGIACKEGAMKVESAGWRCIPNSCRTPVLLGRVLQSLSFKMLYLIGMEGWVKFFIVFSIRDQTQVFGHAPQILYHVATTPALA